MAQVSALTHIVLFNSKLNEFRESGKHCDVSVHVEGKTFKCHRVALAAASEYFDIMFGGNFLESKTDSVILKNIDEVAFEEILRFIYTGNVIVTRENVYSLMIASEFLKLVSVEEICVQFVSENLPLPEIFELLTFASQTQKNSLINVVSRFIMKHFDKLCTDNQFLQFSFDDLNALLSQHWYLSPQNEYMFLDAVIRWLNLRETKEGYFEKLIGKINLGVPIKYGSPNCSVELSDTSEIADQYCLPIESSSLEITSRPIFGLHAYTEDFDGITKIFSAGKSSPIWNMLRTVEYKYDHIRSIGISNHLYCLDYIDTLPTFRVCCSIDVSSPIALLKTPPVILMEFDMSNINNIIYVNSSYDPTRNTRYHRSNYKYTFSDEEIRQGIYGYNVEIDEWFPLPTCRGLPSSSAITASDNVLYLVEGLMDCSLSTSGLSIQALDYRTPKWQNLSNRSYHYSAPITLTCCAHDGKIYACSSCKSYDIEVGMYDLTAGKWQKVKSLNQNRRTFRLLSHENLLWAFGTSDGDFINVETYNSFTQEWNPSPILGMVGDAYSAFMDVVPFQFPNC